jgi:hypothetical protein
MNLAFRFQPVLESLDDRVNLSPMTLAPTPEVAEAPRTFNVYWQTIKPAPTTVADDVVVDGRIITSENYDFFDVSGNETITVDANHTELPAVQKVREAAAR